MTRTPSWLEHIRIHAPREGLPTLPPADKLMMNREMACRLGIGKGAILTFMRSRGMGGRRRTCLAWLMDMEFGTGKAGVLMGHGAEAVTRWVAQGMPASRRHPGGYLRVKLSTILQVRKELRKALANGRKRKKRSSARQR